MSDRTLDIARRALARPEGERQAFLDGACADDPALLAEVAAALAAMSRGVKVRAVPSVSRAAPGGGGGGVRDGGGPARAGVSAESAPTAEGISAHSAAPAAAGGAEGPGASIGPYKILERIGEGGFGYVYMAQQTTPVKRRVGAEGHQAGDGFQAGSRAIRDRAPGAGDDGPPEHRAGVRRGDNGLWPPVLRPRAGAGRPIGVAGSPRSRGFRCWGWSEVSGCCCGRRRGPARGLCRRAADPISRRRGPIRQAHPNRHEGPMAM